MTHHADLFTDRQLTALCTFSDLVAEARARIEADARTAGLAPDQAIQYTADVATYLGFGVSRSADRGSAVCGWDSSPKMEGIRNTFARQAIPMVWDFAEGNPFSASSGNFLDNVAFEMKVVESAPIARRSAHASQQSASDPDIASALVNGGLKDVESAP